MFLLRRSHVFSHTLRTFSPKHTNRNIIRANIYLWCLIAPLLFDIFLALDCLGSQGCPSGAGVTLEEAGAELGPILWVTLALGTLTLSWNHPIHFTYCTPELRKPTNQNPLAIEQKSLDRMSGEHFACKSICGLPVTKHNRVITKVRLSSAKRPFKRSHMKVYCWQTLTIRNGCHRRIRDTNYVTHVLLQLSTGWKHCLQGWFSIGWCRKNAWLYVFFVMRKWEFFEIFWWTDSIYEWVLTYERCVFWDDSLN